MRTSWWMGGALATLALVGGCAQRSAKVDEANLGRLPMEAKQDVFTAQHNVTVARANLSAAERAREENKAFSDSAEADVKAAQARMDAAKSAIKLAEQIHDRNAVTNAQRQLEISTKMMVAARGKRDYARKLSDLRSEEVDLFKKQLHLAESDLALARASTLQRNSVPPAEKIGDLQRKRDDAAAAMMVQETKVASLRDEANGLRTMWEERRREYNVASRGAPVLPATPAPTPEAPERIAPEPLPKEPVPQR